MIGRKCIPWKPDLVNRLDVIKHYLRILWNFRLWHIRSAMQVLSRALLRPLSWCGTQWPTIWILRMARNCRFKVCWWTLICFTRSRIYWVASSSSSICNCISSVSVGHFWMCLRIDVCGTFQTFPLLLTLFWWPFHMFHILILSPTHQFWQFKQ